MSPKQSPTSGPQHQRDVAHLGYRKQILPKQLLFA